MNRAQKVALSRPSTAIRAQAQPAIKRPVMVWTQT